MPRIVGPAKAREIYILNEKIRAKEALRIGLVSKVIPARGNAFQVQVQQIAQRLANEAPLALLRIKVCNDVVCCCCISNLTRHTHTGELFGL